ncbi:hypothetical protein CYMTET_36295 [Cymbomonas tetramitiformis]|uniref:Uncharacterized protein n=1 Tax=Cymbomonas tetramitiformis TaxID=36881 RepID=A0AAE0CHR8_9CHLO|nr:hypothetical protein CYMTET_36295 [Cymbomonas tetramitiformis]
MVEMVRELVEKSAEVDAEDGEGRTALTVALAFGQEAVARALLEAGAGVNAGTGRRPFHAAAEKGMVEMVRELAGKGAEVDAEDGEGRTALTVALAFGQEAAARALLEAGAGVNAGTGQRPLHAAAMKGMEEMVRELVEKSTEVDAEDGERRTALTVALAFGQEAAARALLEAGAGVNAGTGRRPLHMAAERGLVEMVRELVGKGAEVDAEDREGRTALQCLLLALELSPAYTFVGGDSKGSAVGGHTFDGGATNMATMRHAVSRWALKAVKTDGDVGFGVAVQGADLEVDREQNAGLFYFRGGYGNDFTMFAGGTVVGKKLALFERGKLKAGDVLHFVLRGAVLEVALNDSPFEEAFTELPAGVVPLVQLSDSEQKVELVGSARARCWRLVVDLSLLIEMGADVNAGKGQRALHLAAKDGLHEAVRQLLEAGAELGCADDDGALPAWLACSGGSEETVRLMKEAGADFGGAVQWAEANGQCFSAEILQLVQE